MQLYSKFFSTRFLFLLIILFFLAFTLSGCFSKPNETEVKDLLVQEIKKKSNGLIKVINFKKTNGSEFNKGGLNIYQMEWTADLEFSEDCLWDTRTFEAVLKPKNDMDIWLHITKRKQKKGDRVSYQGSTTLRKTEKGWRQ
jgi:hypothetical protein